MNTGKKPAKPIGITIKIIKTINVEKSKDLVDIVSI